MNFLFKLNVYFFFKNSGGQIGYLVVEEVGDQINQQIVYCQWVKWQVQCCQIVGNVKINKQFVRVDMGEEVIY